MYRPKDHPDIPPWDRAKCVLVLLLCGLSVLALFRALVLLVGYLSS